MLVLSSRKGLSCTTVRKKAFLFEFHFSSPLDGFLRLRASCNSS